MVKSDLGQVLLKLEELQEEQIRKTLEPEEKAVVLSSAPSARRRSSCCAIPGSSSASWRTSTRCGVVGEETNKLVGYLAAVSRKLDEPLAVVIQSSSAAGKSSLMEAVLVARCPRRSGSSTRR